MPTDRPQTIDELLKKVFVAGLDCRDEGVLWGTEEWANPAYDEALAALSAIVNQIIGEDETCEDGEDTNQLIAANNQRLRKRNKLRSEQRQRAIALGFSIKEEK